MKHYNNILLCPGADNIFYKNIKIDTNNSFLGDYSGTLWIEFYKNDYTGWLIDWMNAIIRNPINYVRQKYDFKSETTFKFLKRQFKYLTVDNRNNILKIETFYNVLIQDIVYYDDYQGIEYARFSFDYCRKEFC